MYNPKERALLAKAEFALVPYFDPETWERGDWAVTKSRTESARIRQNYKDGYRVCLMRDSGGSYVLSNISSDSIWICSTVEECLDVTAEEEDE